MIDDNVATVVLCAQLCLVNKVRHGAKDNCARHLISLYSVTWFEIPGGKEPGHERTGFSHKIRLYPVISGYIRLYPVISRFIRLYPCELWAEKKPRNTRLFHGLSEPGGGGLDQGCTTVRTLVHVISNSVSVYILYKWSFGDGGARAGRLGGGGRGPHLIMTVEVVISNNNNNNNIYTTTSLYIYTRYTEIK